MVTHRINLGSKGIVDIDDADIKDIDLDKEVVYFEGERLTEAKAAELSKQIRDRVEAARREQAQRDGAKGGRPTVDADGAPSVALGARVAPSTKARLKAQAEAQGRTAADLIREALDEYLDRAS
jgi:predicted ATPase with chaperone activity